MNEIDSYILVSGGRSSRFGSDKANINLDGATLLTRHIEAIGSVTPIVVVGDESNHQKENIRWTREEPAFGGPVTAIAAGLAKTPPSAKSIAVIAVDMPYAVDVVRGLDLSLLDGHDAVIPTDEEGFPQPLCAIYSVVALIRALDAIEPLEGKSMRELASHLNVLHIRLASDRQYALVDIDTPSDLEKVRDGRMD